MPTAASPTFVADLRAALRGSVTDEWVQRGIHATDASHYQMMPAAVCTPVDADDVIAALKVACRHRVPVTPRGGATSLSGQTFGPGLVLDVSRHMDRVLEINAAEGWCRVQPGVIRDRLNAQLRPLGLHFAPDPATGNRATLGGMIGNNTSGTRSILYGKTIDHVLECTVALIDGTVLTLREQTPEQWRQIAAGDSREAGIYRGVMNLVDQHRDEIRARYPKVLRRVSGYNLDEFVEGAGYSGAVGPRGSQPPGGRAWNLGNLIVGSEGTLATLLEAKVRLTPLPRATAVCVVHFNDLLDALRSVPAINAFEPAAVELLDHVVLRQSTTNRATKHMAHFIVTDPLPQAVLIVECFGDAPESAAQRINELARSLRQRGIGYAHPIFTDARGQRDVWETRKLGLGLISNIPGRRKGIAFVEDAAVPVEVLHDYIGRMMRLCESMAVPYSMYAHASVGLIHFRPMLDVHEEPDRVKMRQIAQQAFDWCRELGGCFAGEHGDGVVRGEFVEPFFGPALYEAFRQVKRLFDPDNLMNPGKIVDAPSMTDASLLRFGPHYRLADVPATYHHHHQGGFALAVEQCNGVGACRKLGEGVMCPSYMATRQEKDTTRARANALRLAMSGQVPLADGSRDARAALASDGVHDVLELCLSCKACKSECPNEVDIAKLKGDALQMRHDARGVPLGARLIGSMPDIAPLLCGRAAPLLAALQRSAPVRWLLEKLAGLDRRRELPAFARESLHTLLGRAGRTLVKQAEGGTRIDSPDAGPRPRVVLFNDTYATWMEPRVGVAAVALLESLGYAVTLADAGCCQRPRLSKGLLRDAKARGLVTMARLDVFARQGLPILCLEPSCHSALVDDLPDLADDAGRWRGVQASVKLIDVFLHERGHPLTSGHRELLVHGHCHQKAMMGATALPRLLASMTQGECRDSGAGCCGMAGAFGYEHHDVSVAVAGDRLLPAVKQAQQRGATIVANGVSCRHQLRDLAGVEARHWVEVVQPAEPAAPSPPTPGSVAT
jgi:FAD/FMN-containing dehydrogenase/Fe-S oxidoreductase